MATPGSNEDIMERLRSEVAEIWASQAFFKEAMDDVKTEIKDLTKEMQEANSNLKLIAATSALAAANLEKHEIKLQQLKTYDDRQMGYIAIAGIVGAAFTWVFDHAVKLFK